MRILALLIGLALAPHAYADITDSGNLTIAGQAVIAGTMTVQGSAFSVGGSTFQVAGGSVTLGGRLNAEAAGIKWADGTVQVSSPPSTASFLSTASAWVLLSAQDVTVDRATVTFSGLSSSCTYRVDFDAWTSSAIYFVVLFNNDSNQNYGTSCFDYNTGGHNTCGAESAWGGGITRTDVTTLANSSIIGSITFSSNYGGLPGDVVAASDIRGTNSAIPFKRSERCLGAQTYVGSAPITSIHFVTSSVTITSRTDRLGPFRGHFELWRKGSCHP